MKTVSRMRRSSALSCCQSAMRIWMSVIGELQAALFDQLPQQGARVFVAEPLGKVCKMQRFRRADQLEQFLKLGREQAALSAGEEHQSQVYLAPGQARAWIAQQHRAVFHGIEELAQRHFLARYQFRVARF